MCACARVCVCICSLDDDDEVVVFNFASALNLPYNVCAHSASYECIERAKKARRLIKWYVIVTQIIGSFIYAIFVLFVSLSVK